MNEWLNEMVVVVVAVAAGRGDSDSGRNGGGVVSFQFANCFCCVFSPHHQSLKSKGISEFSRLWWNKIHMIFIYLQFQLLSEAI